MPNLNLKAAAIRNRTLADTDIAFVADPTQSDTEAQRDFKAPTLIQLIHYIITNAGDANLTENEILAFQTVLDVVRGDFQHTAFDAFYRHTGSKSANSIDPRDWMLLNSSKGHASGFVSDLGSIIDYDDVAFLRLHVVSSNSDYDGDGPDIENKLKNIKEDGTLKIVRSDDTDVFATFVITGSPEVFQSGDNVIAYDIPITLRYNEGFLNSTRNVIITVNPNKELIHASNVEGLDYPQDEFEALINALSYGNKLSRTWKNDDPGPNGQVRVATGIIAEADTFQATNVLRISKDSDSALINALIPGSVILASDSEKERFLLFRLAGVNDSSTLTDVAQLWFKGEDAIYEHGIANFQDFPEDDAATIYLIRPNYVGTLKIHDDAVSTITKLPVIVDGDIEYMSLAHVRRHLNEGYDFPDYVYKGAGDEDTLITGEGQVCRVGDTNQFAVDLLRRDSVDYAIRAQDGNLWEIVKDTENMLFGVVSGDYSKTGDIYYVTLHATFSRGSISADDDVTIRIYTDSEDTVLPYAVTAGVTTQIGSTYKPVRFNSGTSGTIIYIRPTTTNTGETNLTINLGSHNLKDAAGDELHGGELVGGQVYEVLWDGTEFRLLSVLAATTSNKAKRKSSIATGRLQKSIAGNSDVTLTQDEASYDSIEFTGAKTGDIIVTLPTIPSGIKLIKDQTTDSNDLKVKAAGQADTDAVTLIDSDNIIINDGSELQRLTSIVEVVEISDATINGAWTDISTDTYEEDDFLFVHLLEGEESRHMFGFGPIRYGDFSTTFLEDRRPGILPQRTGDNESPGIVNTSQMYAMDIDLPDLSDDGWYIFRFLMGTGDGVYVSAVIHGADIGDLTARSAGSGTTNTISIDVPVGEDTVTIYIGRTSDDELLLGKNRNTIQEVHVHQVFEFAYFRIRSRESKLQYRIKGSITSTNKIRVHRMYK